MRTVYVICLALLMPAILLSEILFQSDFESDRIYLAEALKPGAKKVELLPSPEIDRWFPEKGGASIIEPNYPKNREVFQYNGRKGNLLLGVKGIAQNHAMHTSIVTGGFAEWFADERSRTVFGRGRLKAITKPVGSGNYVARIGCDTIPSCMLVKNMPPSKTGARYIRFTFWYSEDFSPQKNRFFQIMRVLFNELDAPRLGLTSKDGQGSLIPEFKTLTFGKTRRLTKGEAISLRPEIRYRFDAFIAQVGKGSLQCSLWVDGRFGMAILTEGSQSVPGYSRLALGKVERIATTGHLFFDDVFLSDSPVGIRPAPPALRYSFGKLTCTDLPASVPAPVATQWQIHSENSWLVPIFSSGRQTEYLKTWPDLASFQLPRAMSNSFAFAKVMRVPLNLPPETPLLARARHMSETGIWGLWGSPIEFTLPDAESVDESGLRVLDAGFTPPGQQRRLRRIRKGHWYDLHLRFVPPGEVSFCDVYLSGEPEDSEVNHQNRGGPFRARDSYIFSLSFLQKELWVKEREGLDVGIPLIGEKGMVADDSPGLTRMEIDKGEARIRIRLHPRAKTGPWKLIAFLADRDRGASPLFQMLFFVSARTEKGYDNQDRQYPLWPVTLALVAFAGIVAGVLLRRKRRHRMGSDAASQVELKPDPAQSARVQSANQFILENYTKPISPQDVAIAIGVTPNWLSKTFKQGTGKNVSQYIIELRINMARQLLRETAENAVEISFRVGFRSVAHFNRTFKQHTGISPLAYRKKQQKSSWTKGNGDSTG